VESVGLEVTHEVDTDGGDVGFSVGVVGKSQKQARLSNTGISDEEELEEIIVSGGVESEKGSCNRLSTPKERGSGRGRECRRWRWKVQLWSDSQHGQHFHQEVIAKKRRGRAYYSGFMMAAARYVAIGQVDKISGNKSSGVMEKEVAKDVEIWLGMRCRELKERLKYVREET
jgi:hypothetical protein